MKADFKEKNRGVAFQFIIILVISFIVYGVYVGANLYKNIMDNHYESIDSMVDVTKDNLSQTLNFIQGASISISASDSVRRWISDDTIYFGNTKNSYVNKELLNKDIQSILSNTGINSYSYLDYVVILENGDILTYSYTSPVPVSYIYSSVEDCYEQIKDEDNYSIVLPPTKDRPEIFFTLRLQADFSTNNSLYIVSGVAEENINKIYNDTLIYEGSNAYIIDKDGIVYSSNDDETLGTQLQDQDRPDKLYIKRRINRDYYYVYTMPKSVLMRETLSNMRMYFLISVLMIILLSITFIKLRDQVSALYESEYESRIMLKETELKNLQHQMNPHFLFNILLTIQIKAKMAGDEVVYKMISSLSSLLRSGIYKDERGIISIREELRLVEYYLELQKMRFEDRLDYSIELSEESIYDCTIPRLIIEPMVENAIVHGVEGISEKAKVDVKLAYNNGDVIIHVIDNGAGFDPKEVDLDSKDSTGIGLAYAKERLQLIYGENYGLRVESAVGNGTDVIIKIPKVTRVME
ncbi:MAG: histidine kinase [Pseudobutyrivibrio sp.]|nr:histidine kinase [Pseudobutyrivibrio sp.]